MDNLELQRLRDLPIEGVAERLGLHVSRHKSLCPFHADHHPSLSFHRGRNTYRCFTCGAHGGTIDLVMNHLRLDFKAACRWLSPSLTLPEREGTGNYPCTQNKDRESSFDASRYARFFEHPWLTDEARRFLFDERRLDERVIRWCRLTSWRDKQGISWLQIPYYNIDGKLIGVQNRRLKSTTSSPISPPLGEQEGEPRFRFPRGSRCSIYNLPILKFLRPGDELWIAEGCSDAWSLLSSGKKAIAIPSATLLKPNDISILKALPLKGKTEGVSGDSGISFHMYPDRDLPGERLFLQLNTFLTPPSGGQGVFHHQLPPGCKDFSELYVSQNNKS